MAEEEDDSTSSASSSFEDDEEDQDDEEIIEHQGFLQRLHQQRPNRPSLQQQMEAAQPFGGAQQDQQAQQDEDKILVRTMLETLGFERKYIDRAIRVYEKNYGAGNYNTDIISEIILRLQEKEQIKKQKQQLLAMNLDPKLAQEIFGNKYNKYKSKHHSSSKKKSKTSGYHSGDIIIYRNEITAQILDKLDDYLQLSWPITKPLYQRAILWANINTVSKYNKHKNKKEKSKTKEKEKEKEKESGDNKKKSGGLFGGIFGGSGGSKQDDNASFGGMNKKYQFKFEKIWKDLMVDEFSKKEQVQESEHEQKPKQMEIKIIADDQDEVKDGEEEKKSDEVDKKKKKKHKKDDGEDVVVKKTKKGDNILCEMMKINGSSLKTAFTKQTENKYEICSIYEICNESVQSLYNKRKRLISQFSLDDTKENLNEYKLWYSISRDQVFKIINNGFKRKYSKSYALGFGHKFYRNAADALNGYGDFGKSKADHDNICYLLYCSVICGESCLGRKDMKIPDSKPNKSYIMYETSVDNLNLTKNKYFITYQDYQAIPLNIICCKQKVIPRKKHHSYIQKKPITSFGHNQNRSYDFDPKIFLQHFNPNNDNNNNNNLQQQQQQQQPQQAYFPPPPQQQNQFQMQYQQHHQPQADNQDYQPIPPFVYQQQAPPPQPQQQQQQQPQYHAPHRRASRHRHHQYIPFIPPNNNNNNQQQQQQEQQQHHQQQQQAPLPQQQLQQDDDDQNQHFDSV